MKEVKTEVKVDISLLQEVIDYLQTKPYNEVHEIIRNIIIATNKE